MGTANANGQVGGLREARRTAGLSQERLARMAGCSAGYIRMLEHGFQPTDSAVLPRLFKALSTTNEGPAGKPSLREGGQRHAHTTP
jgi:transcriptional regulator with XRE-family HTH domain